MTAWHADSRLLARYAGGDVDDVAASSIEAHLVACGSCREQVAGHVPPDRLAVNWEGVLAGLDAPRPGWLERLLTRAAIRPSTARLLAATPTLRASWASSVALAVAFAVLASTRPSGAALSFVVLAPVVPVAAVGIAFSRTLDPSWHMVQATPAGGLRLLFLRTVAAVVPSLALAALAGVVGDVGRSSAVWLLPALALTVLSLLAAPRVPVGSAAAALCGAWALGAVVAEAAARGSFAALRAGGDAQSAVVGLPVQLAAGAIVVLGAAVLAGRAHSTVPTLDRRHR